MLSSQLHKSLLLFKCWVVNYTNLHCSLNVDGVNYTNLHCSSIAEEKSAQLYPAHRFLNSDLHKYAIARQRFTHLFALELMDSELSWTITTNTGSIKAYMLGNEHHF